MLRIQYPCVDISCILYVLIHAFMGECNNVPYNWLISKYEYHVKCACVPFKSFLIEINEIKVINL